jgi:hypothetical protein
VSGFEARSRYQLLHCAHQPSSWASSSSMRAGCPSETISRTICLARRPLKTLMVNREQVYQLQDLTVAEDGSVLHSYGSSALAFPSARRSGTREGPLLSTFTAVHQRRFRNTTLSDPGWIRSTGRYPKNRSKARQQRVCRKRLRDHWITTRNGCQPFALGVPCNKHEWEIRT